MYFNKRLYSTVSSAGVETSALSAASFAALAVAESATATVCALLGLQEIMKDARVTNASTFFTEINIGVIKFSF
jgi:hypothetical protein